MELVNCCWMYSLEEKKIVKKRLKIIELINVVDINNLELSEYIIETE